MGCGGGGEDEEEEGERQTNKSSRSRISRDEKQATLHNLPRSRFPSTIYHQPPETKTHMNRPVDYIINCSMEKFTELLSSEGLTEQQAACCRDIRRRGKNKVNCFLRGTTFRETSGKGKNQERKGNYFGGNT